MVPDMPIYPEPQRFEIAWARIAGDATMFPVLRVRRSTKPSMTMAETCRVGDFTYEWSIATEDDLRRYNAQQFNRAVDAIATHNSLCVWRFYAVVGWIALAAALIKAFY